MRRILALLLAVWMLLSLPALAEDYVNLDERFGDVVSYDYGGVTYYMKDRVSTTLALCANLAAEPQSVELIVLLPIDDDAKSIAPIQLDRDMKASWLEGEDGEKTLGELFGEAEDAQSGCERLVEVVNALFPAAVVEDYAALDVAGLPVLDGVENDALNVTGETLVERLKAVKARLEQDESVSLNGMLSDLSGYIETNMKSGAMAKVMDKADRYERAHRMPFPVEDAEEDAAELLPDLAAFEEIMVNVYFEDTRIW